MAGRAGNLAAPRVASVEITIRCLLLQTESGFSTMKLDLLYEIDVPKPWPGPHPYGQREAEQRAYQ